MRLQVFGSGSGGNCLAVQSAGGTLVFVDLGFSCREIGRRAHVCGVEPGDAAAVLFTHDHDDHTGALAVFHKRNPSVALLANGETADAIIARRGVTDGWMVFDNSETFEVRDLRITPFPTSHDAANPVGFLIEEEGPSALFIATDTGVVTGPMRHALLKADCAVLESNYDPVLLETSDRAWSLKRRVSGDSGHLSNDAAADFVRDINPQRLKTLLLAHISRECNAPDIALEKMRSALSDCGRTDIALHALAQDVPSPLFEF